jgi:hypothetical protein
MKEAVVVGLYCGGGPAEYSRELEYKWLGELYVEGFKHTLEAGEDLVVLTERVEDPGLEYLELYEHLEGLGFTLYELKEGKKELYSREVRDEQERRHQELLKSKK